MKILNLNKFTERLNIGKLNIRDVISGIKVIKFSKDVLHSGMSVTFGNGNHYVVIEKKDYSDDTKRITKITIDCDVIFCRFAERANSYVYMPISKYDDNLFMRESSFLPYYYKPDYSVTDIYDTHLDINDPDSYKRSTIENAIAHLPASGSIHRKRPL